MSAAKWFSAAFAPLLWFAPLAANGQETLPAFPGAEGFGAASVGGRGGRVIKVTNLNASGPGSLQAACEAKGPRFVVFEVSGVIRGDVVIKDSSITIAGQTAPGAGITVVGMIASLFSNWDKPVGDPSRHMFHDMTIRHLRVRPPGPRGSSGDCLQFSDVDRLILDHISCSWGSDENVDLCSSRDVTVQWCTIEESDLIRSPGLPPGTHNNGMILGYEGRSASIHHNLFAHHSYRTPLCGLEVLDHRNNVIYDVGVGLCFHPVRMNRARPGMPFWANTVGNYFKQGPSDPKDWTTGKWVAPVLDTTWAELYAEGNYFTWAGGYVDPWAYPRGRGVFDRAPKPRAANPWPAAPVATHTAEQAYEQVLARAGCFPRDIVTLRTIEEVQKGTGSWGRHDPPEGLMADLKPAVPPLDSDNDGMPDAWETAHGLDPKDSADANKVVPVGASPGDRHRGYTYIEYHINELAESSPQAGQKPKAGLLTPAKEQVFIVPAPVQMTAEASDPDGDITKVEFFQGETKIGEAEAPPYQLAWTSVPPGTYTLTAKAMDDAGETATSDPVTVYVFASPIVDMPRISPATGSYESPLTVTMSCPTQGTTIHYTTDWTQPTESSPEYTGPFELAGSPGTMVRVWARAFRDEMNPSARSERTYVLEAPGAGYGAGQGLRIGTGMPRVAAAGSAAGPGTRLR